MKENKRFNIWKFKKYKLEKYKSIGLFKLFNINKKKKNEFLNLKNTAKEFFKTFIFFIVVTSIIYFFIKIEGKFYTSFEGKLQWLKNIINYSGDNFFQFLIATLGVSGFLVALFYANLSGVFTSKYANLDFNISKAVIEERENRKNLNGIRNYIVINIALILLYMFDIKGQVVLALLFSIYTIKTIVVFINLSKRTFSFSNLNFITCSEIVKIQEAYASEKINNISNNDKNLQNYLYGIAKRSSQNLMRLLEFFMREKDFNAIIEFEKNIMILLNDYSSVKEMIPYNSYWYEEKIIQKSMLKMSGLDLVSYINTGTIPNPERIKNHYWLEECIFKMIEEGLKFLIVNKKIEYSIEVLNLLDKYVEGYLKNGNNKKILDLEKELFININPLLDEKWDRDIYSIQSILDLEQVLLIGHIIDANNYLEKCRKAIEDVDFEKYCFNELLKNNLALFNDERLENVTNQINEEKQIEGKRITDNKYLKEQLYALLYDEINNIINIYESILKYTNTVVENLIDSKKDYQAEIIIARNIEIYNKMEYYIQMIYDIKNEIKKYEMDFKWNKNISQNTYEMINKSKVENVLSGMKIIEKKNLNIKKENEIDIYGLIFFNSYLLTNELLIKEDFDSLKKIHKYLYQMTVKCDYVVKNEIILNGYNTNYALKQYVKPFTYFMNLEGKIIFLSRLNKNKELENMVIEQFNKIKYNQEVLKLLVECGNINKTLLVKDDFVLSSLNQNFENYIRNNENIKFKNDNFYLRDEIESEDEIIRKFGLDNYDFLEIYLCYYVNNYSNVKFKATYNWDEKR